MELFNQERIAEYKAWKEKYDVASAEEKELMEKERKEQLIAQAQEREKKIVAERKQKFMDKALNQINLYCQLLEARKIALGVIKIFDGKVLNNRLTKAVESKLKEFNNSLYASLDISFDRDLGNNVGKLKIRICHYLGSWAWDETSLYISLSPVSDSNRVIWEETEKDERNQENVITDCIMEWNEACNEYEDGIKAAQEITQMLQKYGNGVNIHLRQYISEVGLIGNKWYIN